MMGNKTFAILALICSIWFVLLGWMWVYFINLVFVFPVAIIGFFLWRKSKPQSKSLLHSITGILFLLGLILSLASIFIYS